MAQYVIATTKSWNIENAEKLKIKYPNDSFYIITEKEKLTEKELETLNPRYVFFPHWSWIIPKSVFQKYQCVVFHMTDLPFGRGGSPLQNLIVRGIYSTKVTAIKVDEGLDTGDIYLKEPINIEEGNADEILRRVSDIVFNSMIPKFIEKELVAIAQSGEAECFTRRKPEDSRLPAGLSQKQIYDYIRMLDGEGYPLAFSEIGNMKVFYKNARFYNGKVYADAYFEERDR